jgi:hypothetical protein
MAPVRISGVAANRAPMVALRQGIGLAGSIDSALASYVRLPQNEAMRGIEPTYDTKERTTTPDTGPLASYRHDGFWCELYGSELFPLPHAAQVCARLGRMDMTELRRRAHAAENELFNLVFFGAAQRKI